MDEGIKRSGVILCRQGILPLKLQAFFVQTGYNIEGRERYGVSDPEGSPGTVIQGGSTRLGISMYLQPLSRSRY